MKAHNSVTWFEVRKDSVRVRAVKWILAVVLAVFLNWFYISGLPVSQGIAQMVAEGDEDVFEIEMIENEQEEMEYVEVNPDNPVNEPDETNQISDQSQQAAQENVAGPDNNPTPYLKGDDQESNKIIEGQIPTEGTNGQQTPESQGAQAQQQQQQQQQQEQPMQAEQEPSPEAAPSIEAPQTLEIPEIAPPPPTPDFIEEIESDNPDGTHLTIIEAPENQAKEYSNQEGEDERILINVPPSVAEALSKAIEAQRALEPKEKIEEQQITEEQQQPNQPQTKPSPMPRPRLSPKVLPGPLLNSQVYAARMGPIGFDAKFSQFGHYLSRMFDTIQMQWYSLLDDVTIGQENRPSIVVIEYVLDKNGEVVESTVVESNSGELETLLCSDAVESRAPFGFWTQQMVEQLGEQTTITLKFIYL